MATKKKVKGINKNCFVIAPIGEEGTEIRKRSDQVLKHVISPVARECGYKPIRADKISEPGIITTQIIQHIAEDPMVVADLSGRNANVFYELALRHALKKPVIQLIGKEERIPFDVAATRIITLDHTDLDSVEEAKKEMVKQIKAAEAPNFVPDTPISVAVELQSLLSSEQPEDKRFGDLLSSLQDIQKSVYKCERKLSSPDEILPPAYVASVIRQFTRDRFSPGAIRNILHTISELEDIMSTLSKKPSVQLRRKLDVARRRLYEISHYVMREREP